MLRSHIEAFAAFTLPLSHFILPELSKMMIELMIEFHAWSTSRPVHESDRTADALEKEISGIMETELEQGRSPESTSHISFIGRPVFRIPFYYMAQRIFLRLANSIAHTLKRKLVKNCTTLSTKSRSPSLLSLDCLLDSSVFLY